jgi:hypothetical protein
MTLLEGLPDSSDGRIRSFLLPIFHQGPPCSYITWGMDNSPAGGCSSETQSQPIDMGKLKTILFWFQNSWAELNRVQRTRWIFMHRLILKQNSRIEFITEHKLEFWECHTHTHTHARTHAHTHTHTRRVLWKSNTAGLLSPERHFLLKCLERAF